jgi:hypothetical protein
MSSDTTAFLAGCAITGVAAVLLLRGGFLEPSRGSSAIQPTQPSVSALSSSAPAPSPSATSQQSENDWQFERDLEQQKAITEDLKNQLERQTSETDELKTQLEEQISDTEKLVFQLQQQVEAQQQIIDEMTVQQKISTADQSRTNEQLRWAEQSRAANTSIERTSGFQTAVLWAAGVTVLIVAIGGGVLLIVVIILLVQSQRRYPRPMQVIHPMTPPYIFPEQQLLPSQTTRSPKRTSQIEYYGD